MTEVRQGPTPRVRFRGVPFNEVSVKRESTVNYIVLYVCSHCTVCMFTCLASVSFPVGFEYLILQSVVRLAEVRVGGGGGIATSATVKPQSKVMLHWCTKVLELHAFFSFVCFILSPSLSLKCFCYTDCTVCDI